MAGRPSPHVTVAAVAERGGRYLLVEERVGGRRALNQPAGHWEPGETLLEAVRRETLEETGWRFEPEALVGIYHWQTPGGVTYLRFAFCGGLAGREDHRPLDPAIERVLWLDAGELAACRARHRGPQVWQGVADHRAGRRFPLHCLQELSDTMASNN